MCVYDIIDHYHKECKRIAEEDTTSKNYTIYRQYIYGLLISYCDPIDIKINPGLSNEERAYEIFKYCWINQHIDNVTMTQTEALYENDESNNNLHECEDATEKMSFEEYIEKYGFANGEIYPCYEEFLNNDFENFLYCPEIEKIIDNAVEEETGVLRFICYYYRLSQVLGKNYISFPSIVSKDELLIEVLKSLKVNKIIFENCDNNIDRIKKNCLLLVANLNDEGGNFSGKSQ